MGCHQKFSALLLTASIILYSTSLVKAFQEEENLSKAEQDTCSTDDLNHSALVESSAETIIRHPRWPTSSEEVFHVYTTRAGERLTLETSQNLNYDEPEKEMMLNINTTFYLKRKGSNSNEYLQGFGTTISSRRNIESVETCSFKTNIVPVLIDLVRINFSLFKVNISRHSLLNKDAEMVIQELNTLASAEGKTLKLILNFEEITESSRTMEAVKSFSTVLEKSESLECHSFSTELGLYMYDKFQDLKKLCGGRKLEIDLEKIDPEELSSVLDQINGTSHKVLVLKSSNLFSYDIIEYVKNLSEGRDLFVTSRNKPRAKFGNWQNAQNLAVEILNHLKYGATGFLENFSFMYPLRDLYPQDCSIYNLRPDSDRHYRSPLFYAMAHFSLYLPDGSRLLDSDLFTQPNMFAAHYIGFRTPQNHTVAIVLNDNEHQLLFRLAVDGRIITSHSLKPKSFNTFIIKQ